MYTYLKQKLSMSEKQLHKTNSLSIFRDNMLSIEEFIKASIDNVPNFNPDVNLYDIKKMYHKYLTNYDSLQILSNRNLKLSSIGFFSKTNLNIEYWLDRGWCINEAINKIKKRQSTCNKDIAKKIQNTLKNKSNDEILEINKKKARSSDPLFISKKYGLTLDEAKKKLFDRASKGGKTKSELYKKLNKPFGNRELSYYLEKGLSLEEAKESLSNRQNTCSLESFIKRYGPDKGLLKYNNRIKKFKDNWNNKTTKERNDITKKRLSKKFFYSNESYIFFNKLITELNLELDYKFGPSEYYIYDNATKRIYFYDFCIPSLKIIIEYNGSYWHANELKSSDSWPNKLYTYSDSLAKDNLKKDIAERNNFTYIVIWDYESNLDKTKKELVYIIKNKINDRITNTNTSNG